MTEQKLPPPPNGVPMTNPDGKVKKFVRAYRRILGERTPVVEWDLERGEWVMIDEFVEWVKQGQSGWCLALRRDVPTEAPAPPIFIGDTTLTLQERVSNLERRLERIIDEEFRSD